MDYLVDENCRQNNMVAPSNILISKRINFLTHISRPENSEYSANQSCLNRKCQGIQWSLPIFPKVMDHTIPWAEFLRKENLPHSIEVNDFMYLQNLILMLLEQTGLVFLAILIAVWLKY